MFSIFNSGALGNKLTNKTRRELSKRNLDNLNQCQAGIEVHFKEAEGCYGNKKVRVVRRKGCFICWATKAIVG